MNPADRLKAFKQDLKALLIKYDAVIQANVGSGSDTHGIHDETIEISVRNEPRNFAYTSESVDGWYLDQQNIDELG